MNIRFSRTPKYRVRICGSKTNFTVHVIIQCIGVKTEYECNTANQRILLYSKLVHMTKNNWIPACESLLCNWVASRFVCMYWMECITHRIQRSFNATASNGRCTHVFLTHLHYIHGHYWHTLEDTVKRLEILLILGRFGVQWQPGHGCPQSLLMNDSRSTTS